MQYDSQRLFYMLQSIPNAWFSVLAHNYISQNYFLSSFWKHIYYIGSCIIQTHTHTHTHTYIYIYREREREREGGGREGEIDRYVLKILIHLKLLDLTISDKLLKELFIEIALCHIRTFRHWSVSILYALWLELTLRF